MPMTSGLVFGVLGMIKILRIGGRVVAGESTERMVGRQRNGEES
jgi:hypothetical protein